MRRSGIALLASLGLIGCGAASPDPDEDVATAQQALVTGNGLDTCGPAHDESCAAKLPVKISDTKTILLGKYDVTAGRFRAFVEATNGDLQGYIRTNEPAWWNGPWRATLASASPTNVGNFWDDVGGYGHDWTTWLPASTGDVSYLVGPWNFGIHAGDMALAGAGGFTAQSSGAKPAVNWSGFGPGNEGCAVGDYGARTYWQPDGTTGDDNRYSQAVLDQKALNCTSFYLLAAFCAWDGGRLPTVAELDAAWGAETYPWGTTNPYYADFDGTMRSDGPRDLANYGNSAGAVYARPAQVDTDTSNRLSIPGEFPKGNGPYGHADLAGLVIAMTGDIAPGTDGSVTNAPVVTWHRGGSWQGHQVSSVSPYHFIATNKYIATGARCAYDTGAPAAASFPIGFRAEYFTDATLVTSTGVRIDPFIAGNFGNAPYGVRWSATLRPRYSETYTLTTIAGDGMRVRVNGALVIDDWTSHATATRTGTIALVAGEPVAITVEHYNASGNGAAAKLLWRSASQLEQVIPASALTP